MIIYLYGPDAYKRREKLNWYLGKFREKFSGMTVETFDLAEAGQLPKLLDFSRAQSLFEDSKFGILENVSEADPKDLREVFKISGDSKILTIAISADKALPKDFKIPQEKPNVALEFAEPTPAVFASFIKSEADKRGLKLPPTAIDALLKNYAGDNWAVITELERMALGASPEPFIGEHNFFALATAVQKSGPTSYRLPALERLLSDNEPAAVFNFIASRADAELKTKMADLDAAIKSGKTEYEEALTSLVI